MVPYTRGWILILQNILLDSRLLRIKAIKFKNWNKYGSWTFDEEVRVSWVNKKALADSKGKKIDSLLQYLEAIDLDFCQWLKFEVLFGKYLIFRKAWREKNLYLSRRPAKVWNKLKSLRGGSSDNSCVRFVKRKNRDSV